MTDRQPLPIRSTISMVLAIAISVAAGWLTNVMGGTGALLAVIPGVILSVLWSLRRRHRRDPEGTWTDQRVRRHELWAVALGVLVAAILWNGVSLARYVSRNDGDAMSQKAATWARDHGLGSVIDYLEAKVYSTPPSKDPSQVLAITDGGSSTTAAPGTTAAPATTAPAGGFKQGGTLRVAAQRPGSPLSPYTMDNLGSYTLVTQSFEYLCGKGEGADLAPMLAESWTPNADGSEWTFKLRQGVKWHDGTDFTAKDVVCTFDLLLGKNENNKLRANPRASWYTNVESVTADSDLVATIHLKRPQPSLLTLLASGYSPIYACHVPAAQMRTKPVGTGPFKFVEFKPNEGIKLTKNTEYWKKGKPLFAGESIGHIKTMGTENSFEHGLKCFLNIKLAFLRRLLNLNDACVANCLRTTAKNWQTSWPPSRNDLMLWPRAKRAKTRWTCWLHCCQNFLVAVQT